MVMDRDDLNNFMNQFVASVSADMKQYLAASHVKLDNLTNKVDHLENMMGQMLQIQTHSTSTGSNFIGGFEFPLQTVDEVVQLDTLISEGTHDIVPALVCVLYTLSLICYFHDS